MFTALALAVALSAPVPKAVAPELKWKFTKGDTVYVTTESDTTSAVVANKGGVAAQANVSTSVSIYKLVTTAADEKGATLELTLVSVKEGSAGGGAIPKLAEVAGAAGKVVTLTLDKDNKITKLAGGEWLAKLGSRTLTDEYLRYNVEDLVRAVPGKPLGKNDTWTDEHKFPLIEGVVMRRSDRGSVAGSEDGCVKLEVESDNTMTTEGKNQPFAFDLKGEKGKRTVLFDGKAGRVRKMTEEYTMAGTIDIGNGGGAGGGGVQSIQLTMGMKATITVSDTEPKGGK